MDPKLRATLPTAYLSVGWPTVPERGWGEEKRKRKGQEGDIFIDVKGDRIK